MQLVTGTVKMQREDSDVRVEDSQTPRSSHREVAVNLEEAVDGSLSLSRKERLVVRLTSMKASQLAGAEAGHLTEQVFVVVMAQTYSQTMNSNDEMSKGGTHRRLCLYDLRQNGRGHKILLAVDVLCGGAEKVGLHPLRPLIRHEIFAWCPESWQSGFFWYYPVAVRAAYFSVSGSDEAGSRAVR